MKVSKARDGFSLVELMVVVAIIGILATIAIPNFTKFQAKAKQSNAKAELTGLYTGEKAFFAQYSSYHTNLPYLGYVPDGHPFNANGLPLATTNRRYYVTGFGADGVVVSTQADQPMAGDATVFPPSFFYNAYVGYFPATVLNSAGSALTLGTTYRVTAPDTFTASALGNISGRATADTWTINQDKALSNVSSGL